MAEGFVLTGDFVVQTGSPLTSTGAFGYPSDNGKLIGRAGLPSVVARVPFYAAGWLGDELVSNSTSYTWRGTALALVNPFLVALAAAAFFLLMRRLVGSMRWAIVMAAIFVAASIAWPYAKTGMETALMAGAVITFAGVVYAQRSSSWAPWAVAGFGCGIVVADKPYAVFAMAAMLALLVRPFREADARERRRFVIALLAPLIVWGIAFGAFNWTRTGNVLSTGRNDPALTWAWPFNAAGFFVSPGKGLLLYSPVVVLGLLGLRRFWREQPRVAAALVGCLLAGVAIVAALRFWSDESWGPRYIVWVAWLLLVPVPWFARSAARRKMLAAMVAVAVGVQVLAVVASPASLVLATEDLTGQPIFNRKAGTPLVTPFGRDPIRWIPELSPLLFQAKLVTSYVSVRLGGPAVTTSYAPYEGEVHRVVLDAPTMAGYGLSRPNIWWLKSGIGMQRLVALLAVLVGGLAVVRLWRIARDADGWTVERGFSPTSAAAIAAGP